MGVTVAINLQQLATNPLLNLGLGILGGNTGRSGGSAFANAMQGGLLGLSQAAQLQRQMAGQQLQQKQFEAKEAQRALEEQRAQERQQASMGLLGQAGLTPEQQAYYSTFEDPYGQYQASLPQTGEQFTLAPGAIRYGPGGQVVAFNPQQRAPLVQVGGAMKPNERVNAAMKLAESGYVDTFEQGLNVVDQQTGTPQAPVTQAVQQGAAEQAAGAVKPETLNQQQRLIKANLLKADKDGVTGMERADRSYHQATDIIAKAKRAKDLLKDVKTGVLWGSDFGQAAQSAFSEEASEFFNILNGLATMEKVDMIGATAAKAFDSEKEATQLLKGLISGTLKEGVISKKLDSIINKFERNLTNYENVKGFATKAGVEWLGDLEQAAGDQQQIGGDQQKTVVETRTTPDGRTIVKYSDGSLGFQN